MIGAAWTDVRELESGMSTHNQRLSALRKEVARCKLDGFVLPIADEHLSEYVGSYARRVAWLTGFEGSTGTVVVLATQAAMFVDGRYELQVREQVSSDQWTYHTTPRVTAIDWLGKHAFHGARIGYDPWLHAKDWVRQARENLARSGAELVSVDANPVDSIWLDRPRPSQAKLAVHPDDIAGKSSDEKRNELAQWLARNKADAVVLTALDSIAWTFNVRGQDVAHTPVALAFALVHEDGSADLFVAPEKLQKDVVRHLGNTVRVRPRDAFIAYLETLRDKRIAADPARTVDVIFETLDRAGAKVIEATEPAELPKAIKNAAEIAGHKAAQARDGAALCRFLHWMSVEAISGELDEISAATKLRQFREDTGCLRDLSFETISAVGPNAAKPHYMPTKESNRPIKIDQIYLIDSGGQYIDGTTDVTRTIIVGSPTEEMKNRFTRVLKGSICLSRAVFPVGTRGGQLDILARQHLWSAGLDYATGTGHGVGAYLGVHEGPQRIGTRLYGEPLVAGMILSNEPGYYKSGEYGIRIENLMLVIECEISGAEHKMLGFETLTFAPIDRALIDTDSLSAEEIAWIDAYHADVARVIGPCLEGAARSWLMRMTRPLKVETFDAR